MRLQPLGHLSALESTVCEQSERVYRKTLLQILLFCDAICIERFTARGQNNHLGELCQTSKCAAITYGALLELPAVRESPETL